MKLSATRCKTAKPGAKDVWLNDGGGLYLRVRATGGKTWVLRRKRNRKTQITTLGEFDEQTFGPKEARVRAGMIGSAKVHTVGDLIDKYLAEVVDREHRRPVISHGYLERVRPTLGKAKLRTVSREQLVKAVQDYVDRGARSADPLRSNLKGLFGYGVELGWIDHNPMRDVSRRVTGYEPAPRARVLTDAEIRLLWAETSENARVLRFLLLTGLRIGEAQKGHRDGDRWIVPAEISKNARPHWVHLPEHALAQLPLPVSSATNVQAWLRRWCERHKIDPAFTPHDLRRTAATRMQDDRLNGERVDPFIVERVLNHTLTGVMAVYNQAEYEAERIEAAKKLERVILAVVAEGGRDE